MPGDFLFKKNHVNGKTTEIRDKMRKLVQGEYELLKPLLSLRTFREPHA